MAQMAPMSHQLATFHFFSHCVPIRIAGAFIVEAPAFVRLVISLAKVFMSKKIQVRCTCPDFSHLSLPPSHTCWTGLSYRSHPLPHFHALCHLLIHHHGFTRSVFSWSALIFPTCMHWWSLGGSCRNVSAEISPTMCRDGSKRRLRQ